MDSPNKELEIPKEPVKRAWLILIICPLLLLLLAIIVTTYFGFIKHGDRAAMNQEVSNFMPYILMVNHSLLFIILIKFLKKDGLTIKSIGWHFPEKNKFKFLITEIFIGVILVICIQLFQRYVLGFLFSAMSELNIPRSQFEETQHLPANVFIPLIITVTIFPFVEESIYRGYVLSKFKKRYNTIVAILISSVFFGLFHFGEGIQSMIVNFLYGIIFSGIFLWRKNLITGTVAHSLGNATTMILYLH